uniref:Putative secreted protein n=1 Tax=Anopheles triannulatus TaxID=58253 RepID=A0A2M4B6T8_9DIPT
MYKCLSLALVVSCFYCRVAFIIVRAPKMPDATTCGSRLRPIDETDTHTASHSPYRLIASDKRRFHMLRQRPIRRGDLWRPVGVRFECRICHIATGRYVTQHRDRLQVN